MLKTGANPGGVPMEVFDGIRKGLHADRSQFFKDVTTPFFGANRPGSTVSQGLRGSFWRQGMQASLKAVYDCVKAFSETDFTEDLKKIDVPTLIVHGDDDQIVPIANSALLQTKLVKRRRSNLQRRFTWLVRHAQRSDQRGPAGIHSKLMEERTLAPSGDNKERIT